MVKRIAVDVSLLHPSIGGLSRYLSNLLPCLMENAGASCEWFLYGRQIEDIEVSPSHRHTIRQDHLPTQAGRVISLFTSSPLWAAVDHPDVFWGPAHRLPTWLPAKTRAVVTIHDMCWLLAPDTMRSSTRALDKWLMPRALKRADSVIAVSTATQNALLKHFPEVASKLHVVFEGVSTLPEPLSIESLNLWGVRPPFVLFVGTLEPRKNLRRLLEAFAQVLRFGTRTMPDNVSAQLVLVGAYGWGNENLKQLVTELDLQLNVRILGRVSDLQLASLYRHAQCLAMPSLYEGFGLPLVEAMAQGTPVLTSTTSSMPEVAGPAGRLVDPLDVQSIASGLTELIFDNAARKELARQATEQAALFSWEKTAEKTTHILCGVD